MTRDTDDTQNEPDFVSLLAATRNVTRYLGLNEEQQKESNGEKDTGKTAEKRAEQSAADIERRIKVIVAMQNRLRRKGKV